MPKKKPQLPTLDWFQGRAEVLIDDDTDRDDLFKKIDNMINLDWEIPEVLSKLQWVRPQVELFFRQVIQSAARIIADSKPRISLKSRNPDRDEAANAAEKVLKWLLHAANRRRQETIMHEMAESALRYSMVVQQVIYLPEQIKGLEAKGGRTNRAEAIKRKSPFVVITHSPRNAHPRFSDFGLEEIVVERPMDAEAVIDLMGEDRTKEIIDAIKATDSQGVYKPVLREYLSYDWHAVWVEWGPLAGETKHTYGNAMELLREKWTWTFLPFVVRISGSSLDNDKSMQIRPLLGDAAHGDQFDLLCRVKTMRFSEMLRYAGSAKKYFQSSTRKRPDMDVKSADLMVHIEEDEKIGPLEPAQPDPSLTQLYGEIRADQQRSTLSDILLGGEMPSGSAFASVNLMTHSAMAVLKTPRELIQNALGDLLEIFLLYAHYSSAELKGYGMESEDKGKQFVIKEGDIDPEELYIDVDMSADLPTDRQARMLTAQVGIGAGILTRRQAREDLGVTDNDEMEEEMLGERWLDALQQMEIENERFLSSEMAKQEMRQKLLEELQNNPELVQQLLGGAGNAPPPPSGGGMMVPPEGGGMAGEVAGQPAEGEIPGRLAETGIPGSELLTPGTGGPIPAELNPNATREMQTNRTQGGEEVASA